MSQQKNKLFIGGLGQNATEDHLYQAFDKYGTIVDACIVYDKETGNSRGFGYVTFAEASDAEAAKQNVQGSDASHLTIDGKEINVEYANAKDPAKEAAKRMDRLGDRGGRGRYPPRGRGGPRGRGVPPRGSMRRRGPPERRPPPPSRGYDGYGDGYREQYQGHDQDYPSERNGYGPRRDRYNSYPPRRDGPPPPGQDGPPARYGYDRYPPADWDRSERSSYGRDYSSPPVDRYGGPTGQQRSYGRDW